jgi:hypothetical protein
VSLDCGCFEKVCGGKECGRIAPLLPSLSTRPAAPAKTEPNINFNSDSCETQLRKQTCTDGHRACLPIPEWLTWSMSPWHCHGASGRQERDARHQAQPLCTQEEQELKEGQFGGVGGDGREVSGDEDAPVSLAGVDAVVEGAEEFEEEMRMAFRMVRR